MPDSLPQASLSDIDKAPVNLTANQVPQDGSNLEAWITKFTEVSQENIHLKIEVEALKSKARTSAILDDLIKPYAGKAFWFMCIYCTFVAVVLVVSGYSGSNLKEPTEVLTLMVGSTAVTVIGLVGMVLTGIFVGARKVGG